MNHASWDEGKLKREHLQYFKKYVNTFDKNSKEYLFLKKKIEELERER